MNNNVYIKNTTDTYKKESFNPSSIYPELKKIDISLESDKKIYDDFRELLKIMKFDEYNIDSKKWNPFKEFIHEGDNVLIKPNLVMHKNEVGTTDVYNSKEDIQT